MKWTSCVAMAVSALLVCAVVAPVWAADAVKVAPKVENKQGEKDSTDKKSSEITQGEFAKWLVNVVGLARHLGPNPTAQECFQILLQNNIVPKNGWKSNQIMKVGDLARIIVAAMGRTAEVPNPEKDESFVEYLKSRGMAIGSAGEALNNLGLLMQPSASESVVVSTDPLGKLQRQRPVDEPQNGPDLGFLMSVFDQLETLAPRPLTPN